MRLRYAILCRFAELHADGTFSVFGGGIEGLIVPRVPAFVPNLSILLKLDVVPDDLGTTRLGIAFLDPMGTPIDLGLEEFLVAIPDDKPIVCLVRLPGLEFARTGNYEIRIAPMDMPVFAAIPFSIKIDEGGDA